MVLFTVNIKPVYKLDMDRCTQSEIFKKTTNQQTTSNTNKKEEAFDFFIFFLIVTWLNCTQRVCVCLY